MLGLIGFTRALRFQGLCFFFNVLFWGMGLRISGLFWVDGARREIFLG